MKKTIFLGVIWGASLASLIFAAGNGNTNNVNTQAPDTSNSKGQNSQLPKSNSSKEDSVGLEAKDFITGHSSKVENPQFRTNRLKREKSRNDYEIQDRKVGSDALLALKKKMETKRLNELKSKSLGAGTKPDSVK